jgi:carnitine O-palmitoyltransferase 2
MYLRDRRPVTFTHCPGLGVGLPWNVELIDRVTSLLIHSLRFHKTSQSGSLTPDVYHMKPAKTDSMDYWNHKVRYMPALIATPLSYLFKVYPFGITKITHLKFYLITLPLCYNNRKYLLMFYRFDMRNF